MSGTATAGEEPVQTAVVRGSRYLARRRPLAPAGTPTRDRLCHGRQHLSLWTTPAFAPKVPPSCPAQVPQTDGRGWLGNRPDLHFRSMQFESRAHVVAWAHDRHQSNLAFLRPPHDRSSLGDCSAGDLAVDPGTDDRLVSEGGCPAHRTQHAHLPRHRAGTRNALTHPVAFQWWWSSPS